MTADAGPRTKTKLDTVSFLQFHDKPPAGENDLKTHGHPEAVHQSYLVSIVLEPSLWHKFVGIWPKCVAVMMCDPGINSDDSLELCQLFSSFIGIPLGHHLRLQGRSGQQWSRPPWGRRVQGVAQSPDVVVMPP